MMLMVQSTRLTLRYREARGYATLKAARAVRSMYQPDPRAVITVREV